MERGAVLGSAGWAGTACQGRWEVSLLHLGTINGKKVIKCHGKPITLLYVGCVTSSSQQLQGVGTTVMPILQMGELR